ncbi:hypothetical protein C4D60_Mb00t02090 [Musa balbisiana]|uniref:Uncharacterized protein n=1 Tax=Musa balbisiana TaxID=52838 RepID=A0A4S8I4Z0_MUSBA|nr:hypothetical protein C4D60_Mb00t02090 [Musa balbisiana]
MTVGFGDDLLSNCGNCFGRLWREDGRLWKGQRDAKNAALIPSVRTLADSKLGVDLFRGSASWNSIGVPSSKMTTKQKSPTSGSSIHPRLSEVNRAGRASRALCITPFTISSKDLNKKPQSPNFFSSSSPLFFFSSSFFLSLFFHTAAFSGSLRTKAERLKRWDLMTTKQKSPTSGSSIHPRLSEVNGADRASRALCITPFTISSKGSQYPTRHQSTKG